MQIIEKPYWPTENKILLYWVLDFFKKIMLTRIEISI